MTWISEFLRRLQFRLLRSRFDADIEEEMRLHVDLRAADKQQAGMTPEAARTAALLQFGNTTQLQENSREAWGWTMLDTLRQDVRYGIRTLASNPGFAATAVLSLALGIGANTGMFTILNAVLLRTLPVEDPQELVQLRISENDDEVNTPIWEQVRDQQKAFAGALAYSADTFDLAESGERRPASGLWVSGDFFRVLGVPAMIGRAFNTEDDQRGGGESGPVAVISHSFWNRHFQSDPGVIGKTVRLNRHTFTVVGVTPPWFTGLDVDRGYDVAIPIGTQSILFPDRKAEEERFHWWLRILARLHPGQSIQQASDQMRAAGPEIFRAAAPDDGGKDHTFLVRSAALGFSNTRVKYGIALRVLMATVALVLVIACANIANLLLTRGAARQRELSMRMAIGASRFRVIRQLMTESVLIATLGAAGGFLLAVWGSKALVGLLSTARNPLDINVTPDLRVLGFTIAVTVVTALLFGLAPALRATRVDVSPILKASERGTVRGSTRFNPAKALVAGQVAVCLVLLVGAGLFIGTLRNLLTIDPGFDGHNVLLVSVGLKESSPQQRLSTFDALLSRIKAVPGVASASASLFTPISPEGWAQGTYPEGFTPKSRRDAVCFFNRVSSEYFATMKTPVLMGREFNGRDNATSPPVMIINESAARAFFGTSNPIGRTIGMDKPRQRGERILYQVIGIVKDTKYSRIDEAQRRIAYLAVNQDPDPAANIRYSIRTDGPIEQVIPFIRSAISEVNGETSLEFRNFETQIRESLSQPRIVAMLSTFFGGLALLLAMVGLYGTTSYSVAQRRAEIGVRLALGATRASVILLMLRDMTLLLAGGIVVGLCAALAAGNLVSSLLYGVKPNDPLQLAGAAAMLAAATGLAAYLPARRASRLDPVAALREE